MKSLFYLLTLAVAISIPSWTQEPATTPQNTPPSSNTPVEQQTNAASASKDNSGDQVTKPANKGTNLIGCLEGPDKDGKYTLRSMAHRTGVEVLGSADLPNDSGAKVKLTGSWKTSTQQQPQANAKEAKEARQFQATAVEVLSQHCVVPSEKTSVSKEKQRQREQQQQQNKSSAGDQTSPKQ